MTPLISAARVNHWYGNVTSLNDVSFEVGAGITGLLGPNGAGKTSLMRLLVGLMRPTSGSLRVLGDDPWNRPRLAVRMGYAPEHDGLYGWMTGRGFLERLLALRGHSGAGARDRAAAALERVGLTGAADRRLATYSRGMRQRVKIAQATAHDPEVLILDEPLTGTDPLIRADLIRLIRSFGGPGRAVLVSSHVLHEIEHLTREIIVFHRGRLVASGDIAGIRSLIDRHPHAVRIRTPKPRDLAAALATEPWTLEIAFEEDGAGLTVRTSRPEEFYRRLPVLALERAIPLEEFFSPDDNLEAVFRYLTER